MDPSSVDDFVATHCVAEPGATAIAGELYQSYSAQGGTKTATMFGRELAKRFKKTKETKGPNRNKFIYQGLRLRQPGDNTPAPTTSPKPDSCAMAKKILKRLKLPASPSITMAEKSQPPNELTIYDDRLRSGAQDEQLPEPFTAEELAASYSSLPAADLEPVAPTTQETTATELAPTNDAKQDDSAPIDSKTDSNQETTDSSQDNQQHTTAGSQQDASSKTNTPQQPVAAGTTTQPTTSTGDAVQEDGEGHVTSSTAVLDPPEVVFDLPPTREVPGETRAVFWERARRDGRAAGLPRGQGPGTAYEWANREVERVFDMRAMEQEPKEPEPTPDTDPSAKEPTKLAAADEGVPGLGDLPSSWGELPSNASLQAEISWVSANRLRVRDGNGVDLSRALSPAPSYSALSWLETSILFPSKFADISVKATQNQEDEKEHIRREKMAIEEVRGLLEEMLEG